MKLYRPNLLKQNEAFLKKWKIPLHPLICKGKLPKKNHNPLAMGIIHLVRLEHLLPPDTQVCYNGGIDEFFFSLKKQRFKVMNLVFHVLCPTLS